MSRHAKVDTKQRQEYTRKQYDSGSHGSCIKMNRNYMPNIVIQKVKER